MTTERMKTNEVSCLLQVTSIRKFSGCSKGSISLQSPHVKKIQVGFQRTKRLYFAEHNDREKIAAWRNNQSPAEGLPGVFSWVLLSLHLWVNYSRWRKKHLKGLEVKITWSSHRIQSSAVPNSWNGKPHN